MLKENAFIKKLFIYRFEFRHLTSLLIILIVFLISFSVIQKSALHNFLIQAQKWYQQDSAERLANLTSTSIELLLENVSINKKLDKKEERKIIQSFNILFSQRMLQQNVKKICLMLIKDDKVIVADDGEKLYKFLSSQNIDDLQTQPAYQKALQLYLKNRSAIKSREQIFTIMEGDQRFHIFIPFVPKGEYLGVFYMENTPNFSFITSEIISSYDKALIIYSSLILFGLLAMYLISSHTVNERDKAQKLLFEEKEKHLKEQIEHEKESIFTNRIYHTHHKAEKVMGFIKEDLRQLSADNTEETINRVTKYSNFISRVIYDMKWYDPPLSTIRNLAFVTDLNEVIRFIVKYIFLRISSSPDFEFKMELADNLPKVHINEFVIWEIIEPLIQNSIDHSHTKKVIITIKTEYSKEFERSKITIADNGKGILPELLELDSSGVKKLFLESVTTKKHDATNRGYGCYIAYEISTRCGWKLDAKNMEPEGCAFEILI